MPSVTSPEARCPNCGTPTDDNFCPHCGQENERRIVSLRLLVKDAIDNFFTLDARLPQTIVPLLIKPGLLTREYIAGRRARYARPSRLYLAVSVIFFFMLSIVSGGQIDTVIYSAPDGDTAAVDSSRAWADSLYAQIGTALRAGLPAHVEVDRSESGVWVEDDSTDAEIRLDRVSEDAASDDMETQFMSYFTNYLPKMMFVMLPVFALLLKLLYLRRQRYYVGHLIFALNYHSFAFLVFLATTLATALLPTTVGGVINALLILYLHVYLFLAMYRVYNESWGKTLLKFFVLYICYNTVLGLGVGGIALLALRQMGELPF